LAQVICRSSRLPTYLYVDRKTITSKLPFRTNKGMSDAQPFLFMKANISIQVQEKIPLLVIRWINRYLFHMLTNKTKKGRIYIGFHISLNRFLFFFSKALTIKLKLFALKIDFPRWKDSSSVYCEQNSGMFCLDWTYLNYMEYYFLRESETNIIFLQYVAKFLIELLVSVFLWLLKTLVVRVLASYFYVTTYF
jgi:hypothetical protein